MAVTIVIKTAFFKATSAENIIILVQILNFICFTPAF